MGQVVANPLSGFDKVDCVVIVLFDPGADGEDVRVENDIFGGEANFIDQQAVGALTNFGFSRKGVCLALFIERHHHNGSTKATAFGCLFTEGVFSFFERDGVHHRLALNAL